MVLRKRIIFSFSFLALCFVIVLVRALYIQVINRDKLLQYSNSQLIRKSIQYPNRGNIYDRNGQPLAINITTYSIFAIPKLITNQRSTLKKLAKIVSDLNYNEMNNRLKKRDRYTWIARKISLDEEQLEKIKKINGIYVERTPSRYYPNNELLSQTIGFVGVDNTGLSGIEYNFDKDLRGKEQIIKYFKDAKGRPIQFKTQKSGVRPKDIYLSIDKKIQAIVEKHLKEAVIEHKAVQGGAGVIDAATGEIWAMANYPTFDPNTLKSSNKFRKLSFISDPIEPGSIFKTLTIISALENNIIRPESHFFCEYGRFLVGGHVIKEAEQKKKYEWLSVTDILKHSSNIGTTKIAFDLTYPRLRNTLLEFGIGKKTGIELPGESRGIYTNKKKISDLSLSNISFGQGVATTGIQMLTAYAAIANKGVYVPPTILKRNNDDYIIEKKRIFSEKTAIQVEQMLIKTVEEGTATSVQIPYFKVAGKTSTAQKASKSGGYSGHIPGLIAYPSNVSKRFVVYVYIDEPKGPHYYGSSVAGPVLKKIMRYILYKKKEYSQLAHHEVKDQSKKIIQDAVSTIKSAPALPTDKSILPNFVGLDKLSAVKHARKIGVLLEKSGAGVVYKQYPHPGTKIKKNMKVKLNFRPPHYE